ncbi:MAG: peptidase [Phycisphaerae bacterium]|nr:peptidase [Phycisphaerae bacterium]
MKPSNLAAATTRRHFLRAGGTSVLAAGAAPAFLYAQDKAQARNPIVGTGDHRYECIHDWATANLPDGHHYGNASHGVAVDSEGLIYFTHKQGKPGSIFVFDAKGKFVKVLGDFHVLGGQGHGHGIDIREEDGEEFIYLAASDSRLGWAKMTRSGELVWRKERKQLIEETGLYKAKSRYRVTNTSFSPDGGYFLGDGYGSNYVHQYDRAGKYLRSIGGSGTADGKFRTPHGHWLDQRDGVPKLVVCDRANKRLQWFDMDGKHLKSLGGFLFPADIDIRGEVMLVPDLHARVTLLDKNDKVITHLGDDEAWRAQVLDRGTGMRAKRKLWKPGRFVHPHDACFDHQGNIFVTEWVATGRVTKLRRLS